MSLTKISVGTAISIITPIVLPVRVSIVALIPRPVVVSAPVVLTSIMVVISPPVVLTPAVVVLAPVVVMLPVVVPAPVVAPPTMVVPLALPVPLDARHWNDGWPSVRTGHLLAVRPIRRPVAPKSRPLQQLEQGGVVGLLCALVHGKRLYDSGGHFRGVRLEKFAGYV